MEIAYICLLLLFNTLNVYMADCDSIKPIPNRIGYNAWASFTNILITVQSIWYLGWMWGFIVAVLVWLNLFDACLIWPFKISLFRCYGSMQIVTIQSILSLIMTIHVIFTIVSFFLVDFEQLREYINYSSPSIIPIFFAILVIGFVIRILVKSQLEENLQSGYQFVNKSQTNFHSEDITTDSNIPGYKDPIVKVDLNKDIDDDDSMIDYFGTTIKKSNRALCEKYIPIIKSELREFKAKFNNSEASKKICYITEETYKLEPERITKGCF